MSEEAPSYERELSDAAKADLAQVDRVAELKKQKIMGDELFGKNDGEMVPNKDEVTSSEYFASRPADGIIRNGDALQNSMTGRFESTDNYLAQTETTINDRVQALRSVNNNVEVYESPDYENMKTPALALAIAKANMLGEVKVAKEIHATFEHLLMEAATDPANPDGNLTDIQYNEEIVRFDRLVELAEGQQRRKYPERTADIAAEVAASGEPVEASTDQAEVADGAEGNEASGKSDEVAEGDERSVYFGDQPVVIQRSFLDPSGGRIYEVRMPDNKLRLFMEEELTFKDLDAEEVKVDPASDEQIDAAPGAAQEKKTIAEKLKDFWNKHKEVFDPTYWGARWTTFGDRVVNRGTENMSEEDAEKKRNRNRGLMMLGVAAGGIVLIGAAAGITHVLNHLNDVDPSAVPSAGHGIPTHHGNNLGEGAAPTAPTSPDVGAPDPYNIHHNEGGYELFKGLGLDPSKWANNREEILKFSQDFKLQTNGDIWIRHTGPLSTPAQAFINGLK